MAAGWGNPAAITADDWPVAPIPTTPAPNHPSGVLIPLRWPHHGNLRILVDELDVFVSSDDLYALAEYEDLEHHPHPTLLPTVTWAKQTGDPLVAMYTLVDAVAVLEHRPTHQTGELLEWLRDQLPLILRDEVIDAAIGLEDFLGSYTVAQAARVLDRDPAISIGQNTLFEHLALIGLAERDLAGLWHPTRTAIRGRLLTIREVIIRPRTKHATTYQQLYVTPAGLDQLRRTLRALHAAPPDPVEPEQLPIPD